MQLTPDSPTRPLFESLRNAGSVTQGALRDDTKNGCVEGHVQGSTILS